MSTGVSVFTSADSGTPGVIDGTAGSLCNVLDICLVNGNGGSHPAAGSSGGVGAWSIAFTGTNKRAYRPASGGGNRFYFRVQDDAPGAAGAQEARVVGYESMTTVDAGTNPFPTVAQQTNGLFVRKSAAASSVARSWKVIADDRTCYVFIQSGDSAGVYLAGMWGDTYSNLSGDGFRTGIIWRVTENSNSVVTTNERFSFLASGSSAQTGNYVARSRSGSVGALSIGKNVSLDGNTGTAAIGANGVTIAYPNGEDGGLYLTPIYLFDPTTSPATSYRGRLRGIWNGVHPAASFNDGDTFTGVGDFSGKTFMIIKSTAGSGYIVAETSDTWDTSS